MEVIGVESLPGVKVIVGFGDRILEPENDGFIGEFEPGDKLLLAVQALPPLSERLHGIDRDGKNNVVFKRNEAVKYNATGKIYESWVEVREDGEGLPYTKYPQNVVRLLEVTAGGRAVSTWTIALIAQYRKFFRTVVRPFENVECFRDAEGQLACPFFADKWPQLVPVLAQLLASETLPPISEYRPEKRKPRLRFKPGTGRVDFWSFSLYDAGGGAIETSEGMVRAYWKKVEERSPNGLRYLVPGELVAFDGLEPPTQTTDRNTGFKLEARGIRPITS